jgi:hypothetical protein
MVLEGLGLLREEEINGGCCDTLSEQQRCTQEGPH